MHEIPSVTLQMITVSRTSVRWVSRHINDSLPAKKPSVARILLTSSSSRDRLVELNDCQTHASQFTKLLSIARIGDDKMCTYSRLPAAHDVRTSTNLPLPWRGRLREAHPDLQHGMRPGGVPVEFRLGVVQALLSPVEVLQQLGRAATRQPRQALHVTGAAAHPVRRAGLPEPQRGAADLSREEVADLAGFVEGCGLGVRIKADLST